MAVTIHSLKSPNVGGYTKGFEWPLDGYFFILKVDHLFQCVVEKGAAIQQIFDFTGIVSGGSKSI